MVDASNTACTTELISHERFISGTKANVEMFRERKHHLPCNKLNESTGRRERFRSSSFYGLLPVTKLATTTLATRNRQSSQAEIIPQQQPPPPRRQPPPPRFIPTPPRAPADRKETASTSTNSGELNCAGYPPQELEPESFPTPLPTTAPNPVPNPSPHSPRSSHKIC